MTVLLCKMCDDKDGCNGGDYFLSGSKRNLENAYFLVINSVIWFTLSIYQRLNENVQQKTNISIKFTFKENV